MAKWELGRLNLSRSEFVSETKLVHPHQVISSRQDKPEIQGQNSKRGNSDNTIPVKVCYTRESNFNYRDGSSKQKQRQIQHQQLWLDNFKDDDNMENNNRVQDGRDVKQQVPQFAIPEGVNQATANLLMMQMTIMQTLMANQMEKKLDYKRQNLKSLPRNLPKSKWQSPIFPPQERQR